MAPMNNEYVDIPSTRGNLRLHRPVHRQRGRRLPARLRAPGRAVERARRQPAPLGLRLLRPGRLARHARADAEPRPALRLHDAVLRGRQPDGQLRSGDRRAGLRQSDGSLEDRALVTPDRNNFGPRLGVVYQLNEQTVLRGGYGIFYNPLDRIGSEDQLALNPPGLRNINQTTTSTTTPVLMLRDGFPANYLDPVEHRAEPAADPRREPERRERAASISSPSASSGRSVATSSCRPTSSATSAATSPCCAI